MIIRWATLIAMVAVTATGGFAASKTPPASKPGSRGVLKTKPPPVLTQLHPPEGDGYVTVEIHGSGFQPGCLVYVDGQWWKNGGYLNPNVATFNLKGQTTEVLRKIQVKTHLPGQLSNALTFKQLANLSLKSIAPTTCKAGDSVDVHGSGFKTSCRVRLVKSTSSVKILPINFGSSTHVQFRVPHGTQPGSYWVNVTCGEGKVTFPAILTVQR